MLKNFNYLALACLLGFSNVGFAEGGRWYGVHQVTQGKVLFEQNCVSCHGANAESVSNWKSLDSNGKAQPPPLNGTGHTWHHSLPQLRQTIQDGSIQLGGSMPAFKSTLDDNGIEALVAYFQSKWPEEIYRKWADNFKVADRGKNLSDITVLLKQRLGTDDIADPTETGVEGVYQTQFGDKFAYLIENGRYVFIGDMVDLENSHNITEASRRGLVRDRIAETSVDDMIIFPARDVEKTVLNVFTDTSCPYCKKLHEEIPYLQDAGISVRYLPFPRGGNRGPGYTDLKRVWCASDKLLAMNIAKDVADGKLGTDNCEDAKIVDRGYELGNRIGVTGTPALYSSAGEKFNGYVPYQRLIPMLLQNH